MDPLEVFTLHDEDEMSGLGFESGPAGSGPAVSEKLVHADFFNAVGASDFHVSAPVWCAWLRVPHACAHGSARMRPSARACEPTMIRTHMRGLHACMYACACERASTHLARMHARTAVHVRTPHA